MIAAIKLATTCSSTEKSISSTGNKAKWSLHSLNSLSSCFLLQKFSSRLMRLLNVRGFDIVPLGSVSSEQIFWRSLLVLCQQRPQSLFIYFNFTIVRNPFGHRNLRLRIISCKIMYGIGYREKSHHLFERNWMKLFVGLIFSFLAPFRVWAQVVVSHMASHRPWLVLVTGVGSLHPFKLDDPEETPGGRGVRTGVSSESEAAPRSLDWAVSCMTSSPRTMDLHFLLGSQPLWESDGSYGFPL